MNRSGKNAHYSYSIYADSAIAGQFDDFHFGGPVGRLIVEMQEHVLLDFLVVPRALSLRSMWVQAQAALLLQ